MKGSQSSLFLLTWLADWLGWVNPNLPSRGYQGARVVYCPGSHTRENLFSTTQILSIPDTDCNARQTHRPSPLQPGGKPPVATNLNLTYSLECASTNSDCSCPGDSSDWPSVTQAIPVSRSGASVFCSCPWMIPWCPHSMRGGTCT